jgi:hypothetical protein
MLFAATSVDGLHSDLGPGVYLFGRLVDKDILTAFNEGRI